MTSPTIGEFTLKNTDCFDKISDYFVLKIFIKEWGRDTCFSSLEPGLSTLPLHLQGKDKTSLKQG
jgi:hypothetical protein